MPIISLHAMDGMHESGLQAMRVQGCCRKRKVHIMVDTSSSYNVLNLKVAKEISCTVRQIYLITIIIAKLPWEMQGVSWIANFLITPIGGCDMVLGIK